MLPNNDEATMTFFIDRRNGAERRRDNDRRDNPRLDLSHKRRRKGADRRTPNRDMLEDFYAYEQSQSFGESSANQ